MTLDFTHINKILIIRLSSLGDILLTTPLVRSIKKKYPQIEIDFLLKEEYSEVLKNNPHINKILLYPKEKKNNLTKYLLNSCKYDLVIDLQNNIKSRLISSKLKAQTVRFRKYTLRKILLVKTKINLMKNLPSIPERYAKTIGIELDNQGIEIITDKNLSDKLLGLKNIVGICPGAKHFTKRYPIEYQIEICKFLLSNNFNVVLFGGKIDKKICDEISSSLPQVINLQNEDDIMQTVANMKQCDVIICNDSGLMHVASSLNKKLIVIFGSTVKEFGFMPYNCKSSVIIERHNLACRPCSHIGKSYCPKSHFACMKELKPEIIIKQLSSIDA